MDTVPIMLIVHPAKRKKRYKKRKNVRRNQGTQKEQKNRYKNSRRKKRDEISAQNISVLFCSSRFSRFVSRKSANNKTEREQNKTEEKFLR